MVEKNQNYEVDIEDMGIDGEGIAKIDGYTVFVDGALKGERINTKILKVNTNFGYGKLLDIIKRSDFREEPICPVFGKCGGCNLQHLNYEEQLKHKISIVKTTLKKQLGYEPLINDAFGMGYPFYYRNKAQYPVSNDGIGFYSDRTHNIVKNDICFIQNEIVDKLAKNAYEILKGLNVSFYDEETGNGFLRHIVARIGLATGECMLILVTNDEKFDKKKEFIQEILLKYPNLTSIIQNINTENTNVILGEKRITLYGKDYIVDKLGEYEFKISPLSFYQVNSMQAALMYGVAKQMADFNGDEIVFDLYCGIGTISLFMANSCKKVYGVEVVPEAVKNAKENAKLNKIKNAEFTVGEVEEVLPKLSKKGIKPNVIFVDPPRKGLDETTIKTILELKPEKMIYISCNPATLARDLKELTNEIYEIKIIKLIDMFPQTNHCETISILKLK